MASPNSSRPEYVAKNASRGRQMRGKVAGRCGRVSIWGHSKINLFTWFKGPATMASPNSLRPEYIAKRVFQGYGDRREAGRNIGV
jgi:hypothetical protein